MALAAWENTDTERRVEVPWMLARLGRVPRLLDVGSAGAPYLDELAARADELFLLDPRPVDAPQGAVAFASSITAVHPFWDEFFDVVTCISTLDHVGLAAYGLPAEDGALEKAAGELWRVLRPGGRLLLTTPAGRDLLTTHPEGGQRVFSLAALEALFPPARWRWLDTSCWRLRKNRYVPAAWNDIAEAGYAGHRAAGVLAVELEKADWSPIGGID